MALGWFGVEAGVMGTMERNLADRLLKRRTSGGHAALDPGNWGAGSDGAGGGSRMNPADALIGLKAATVQVAGYTSRNATGFQSCLEKLCHNRQIFEDRQGGLFFAVCRSFSAHDSAVLIDSIRRDFMNEVLLEVLHWIAPPT